jgi:hypothetical protein
LVDISHGGEGESMKIILLALTLLLVMSLIALPIALWELRTTQSKISIERLIAANDHTRLLLHVYPNDPGSGGGGGGVNN